MCGIAGFAGAGSLSDLLGMMHRLALRGPDDSGTYTDQAQQVFLGHRRLSIVDIGGGHQPMSHQDGTLHVVFNGEIYNHQELREELKAQGHIFKTDHSDTEVLLHGFRQWGSDLTLRLNGMFAFAIFDASHQTLYLARDRLGEKPLFYTFSHNGIVFASELKAVLQHSEAPRTISKEGMKKFFAYGFVPAPSTIIESVYKLAPGQQLCFDLKNRSHQISQYWQFKLAPDVLDVNSNTCQLKKELKSLVNQAVERRLMSDVPVGVFLSGGVDSTIVLSSVALQKEGSSINTFSIGFKEKSFDETSYARSVSRYFGTSHHEEILSAYDSRETLERVLDALDEPLGDPSILPTHMLAVLARQQVKVALSGDGADELFAGYDPFKALKLAKVYSRVMPKSAHDALVKAINKIAPSDRNMSLEFRLKRTLRGLSYPESLWNPVWLGPLDPEGLESLFGEETNCAETYAEVIDNWQNSSKYSLIEHTLEFYTKLYLPNNILTKVDRASMLTSLEARAPFLDNDLVAFVQRLPSQLKLSSGTTKYLLKEAFKDTIPEFVINRPKKGFGIPLSAWLRAWRDESFIDDLPYINHDWLRSVWHEHLNKEGDHRQLLWCAICMSRFVRSLEQIKILVRDD